MKKAYFAFAVCSLFLSSVAASATTRHKMIVPAFLASKATQFPTENEVEYWARNIEVTPQFNSLTTRITSAAETPDGGIIAVANVYTKENGIVSTWKYQPCCQGTDRARIMAVKLGPGGEIEWKQAFSEKDLLEGQSLNIYGDRAYFVSLTSDGGYIIGGEAMHPTVEAYSSALIVKLDGLGKRQWSRAYQVSATYNSVAQIEETEDGYIVFGQTRASHSYVSATPNFDIFTMKIGKDGHVTSSRVFGHPYGDDIVVSAVRKDDKFTLLIQRKSGGGSFSIVTVDSEGRFVRMTPRYDFMWLSPFIRVVDMVAADDGYLVLADDNYKMLTAGGLNYPSQLGVILIKLDEELNVVWTKNYKESTHLSTGTATGLPFDTAAGLSLEKDGNIVILANSHSTSESPLLMRLDSSGILESANAYNNSFIGEDILPNRGDGYFIIFQNEIFKTDASGQVEGGCSVAQKKEWPMTSDILPQSFPRTQLKSESSDANNPPFSEENVSLPPAIESFPTADPFSGCGAL